MPDEAPSHSGNYHFVSCDDSQSNTLSTILPALHDALLPSIQDAQTSESHPSAAYEIFFKDPSNAHFVADVIRNITLGTAMYPPKPHTNGNPTFICPKKGEMRLRMPDGQIDDAYTKCITANPALAASYIYPGPWIILCPLFFEHLEPFPPDDSCPVVSRGPNRFIRKVPADVTTAGSSVWQNQMWILFHEIVHYYLYAQPGYVVLKPEVYNINEAWALNAGDALRNSENYVYYAATVLAKCSDWPALRDNEHELIDIDPDLTDSIDHGSDTAAGNAVEVADVDISDLDAQVNF
ncbi:MAG: hypothetical protein Q9170_002982 [Blastenia crenularia]